MLLNCGVGRLLRVPWTARRSNQSILKEISPGCSLEGLMLKLKLQYFGHLMGRTDSLEKTLMLGKIKGKRRREWQKTRWLDFITDSKDMNLSKFWEIVKDSEGLQSFRVTKSQTQITEQQTLLMCEPKNDPNELVYKTKTDPQSLTANLWLPKGKGRRRDKSGAWD